jgi:hypothetical protein
MADSVTSQTILDGDRNAVLSFTNVSDGTGESAVLKVDVSALQANSSRAQPCTGVVVRRVIYDCFGMSVSMLWDATTDVRFSVLAGYGTHDFSSFGGIPNNAAAGKTGDILFTTNGASAGDTYSIVLELEKQYG